MFSGNKVHKRFVAKTSWLNSNAFCVNVDRYEKVPHFIFWHKWVKVASYQYGSWDDFFKIMWIKHMLSGTSEWFIDTKI